MSELTSYDPSVLALREFKAGKYEECLKHLNELTIHLKQNKRVLFNKAVTEFYLGQMKNVDAFRKYIVQVTGQQWPAANVNEIKSPTDCIAFYSYAVLLYHTRHYAQAFTILEKLFTFKDQITDGSLACGIVLLLMEVSLCRRLPEKIGFFGVQSIKLFHKFPEYSDLFEQLKLRSSLMNRKQLLPPSNFQSIEWLFLRAHQQYINGDIQGAVMTLSQSRQIPNSQLKNPDADNILAPINNNLGVLYSAIKKNNFSIKCMQEALKEHTKTLEGEKATKMTTTKDRPLYAFNLGVALLRANRPEDAFECLVEAARHFPNNPRIWLRLAECCVIYYTRVNRQEIVVRKISSGPHAKLIPGPINKDKYATSSESYAIPTLSLEFAALCLMNAVTLLPLLDPPPEFDQFSFQVAPSSPLNYKQYCNLRNSVLLLYTFVCLRLSDPTSALYHCTALLVRPGSPTQRALAHLYAAEALIGLDRISEAIDHLNPTVIHDIATKINSGAQDTLGVAVWLNGAVCHAVRGDLITARNILLQINSPRALPLQLYLEMCAGNVDNCRALLRKFTQVPYTA